MAHSTFRRIGDEEGTEAALQMVKEIRHRQEGEVDGWLNVGRGGWVPRWGGWVPRSSGKEKTFGEEFNERTLGEEFKIIEFLS